MLVTPNFYSSNTCFNLQGAVNALVCVALNPTCYTFIYSQTQLKLVPFKHQSVSQNNFSDTQHTGRKQTKHCETVMCVYHSLNIFLHKGQQDADI